MAVFEATAVPSLMILSSQWYTKSEQAPRFAIGTCGNGFAQVLGGLISFGFQQVKLEMLAGWRIMFLVLGCTTVLVGIAIFVFIPDTPMKARFLSVNEKVGLLRHVSVNRTGIENRTIRPAEILEALGDVQYWLFILGVICVSLLKYQPLRKTLLTIISSQSRVELSLPTRLHSSRQWVLTRKKPLS